MEYVEDRRNGITSGKDEKLFQQTICAHYNGRLTLDDVKEMINIAMNQGKFEFYMQRDHGIVTECQSEKLLKIRRESLHARQLFQESSHAIFGGEAFEKLKQDVSTKKAYANDDALYSAGAMLDEAEKYHRTMFAIGLHTIERKVMKICAAMACSMELTVFSSVFDGLQVVHPRVDDWIGKLNAYRQECHDKLLHVFGTHVYLVEKPFYISGVAHADCESDSDVMSTTSDANCAVRLDSKEHAFGRLLQNAYRVA
eukprot:7383759-Prymnesium_polylepis.1